MRIAGHLVFPTVSRQDSIQMKAYVGCSLKHTWTHTTTFAHKHTLILAVSRDSYCPFSSQVHFTAVSLTVAYILDYFYLPLKQLQNLRREFSSSLLYRRGNWAIGMMKNFSKTQRDLEYLGLVPVLWSIPNNILYSWIKKSQHRESEDRRKLDRKTVSGTFIIPQVHSNLCKT